MYLQMLLNEHERQSKVAFYRFFGVQPDQCTGHRIGSLFGLKLIQAVNHP